MYTKTYVCDFACDTLAVAACVLCLRHGCEMHLPNAVRVSFEIGAAYCSLPDLPLDGIDPIAGVSPSVVTFETWAKLKPEERTRHITSSALERETAERRVCGECWASMHAGHYRYGGGATVIRAALESFVAALRAGLTVAGLKPEEKQ